MSRGGSNSVGADIGWRGCYGAHFGSRSAFCTLDSSWLASLDSTESDRDQSSASHVPMRQRPSIDKGRWSFRPL